MADRSPGDRDIPVDRETGIPIAAEVDLAQGATLDSLAGADNYLAFLVELIEPHLGESVLEIGAGHGDLTELIARPGRSVLATDLSTSCLEILDRRFAASAGVTVQRLDASTDFSGLPPVDTALAVNVVEHIRDDRALLARMAEAVGVGGNVVVFVPAFASLYGPFDEAIGHHRRYRAALLRARMVDAGLTPRLVRHVNLPGFLAWWLTVRVLGTNPTGSSLVGIYDRVAMPLISRIESRWTPPFGQSLLAVGEVLEPEPDPASRPDRG